jgi:hypothetical protein
MGHCEWIQYCPTLSHSKVGHSKLLIPFGYHCPTHPTVPHCPTQKLDTISVTSEVLSKQRVAGVPALQEKKGLLSHFEWDNWALTSNRLLLRAFQPPHRSCLLSLMSRSSWTTRA